MLRTNLSTRPFYNARVVHALAGLAAIALLTLTAWQIVRVVRLSRYKTELNTAISRDRGETDQSGRQAQQVRRGLDQKQLSALSTAAGEANDLIAQRTFSWTELFNEIEATLPDDVMLMGVHPEIKDGVIRLQMDVQGKSEDMIDTFWDRLQKTGQFHEVVWSNVNVTEDGLQRMVMSTTYTPGARPAAATTPDPAPAATPAPAPAPAEAPVAVKPEAKK
jgi:hypothetical protein